MPIKKSVLVDLLESELDHDEPHTEINSDGLLLKKQLVIETKKEDDKLETQKEEKTQDLKPVDEGDKDKSLQKNFSKKQKRN